MRIVRSTEKFSAELKEFMGAAVQRRRDDDGFRGSGGGGKSRNAMDLDSDNGNRLVCVTGGVSYLGRAIVKRLLVHGYSVRIVVDCPGKYFYLLLRRCLSTKMILRKLNKVLMFSVLKISRGQRESE